MPDGPERTIFISYRRRDTAHIAGRLFDRLEARFGTGNVFMDVDSITPGSDFTDAIKGAVGSCDVMLVLIGSQWIDALDERGRRRLEDPDDLVALEITSALERRTLVIPVVVDGAELPRRQGLPDALAGLVGRQSVALDHATFRTDVTTLLSAIDHALSADPSTSPPFPALSDAQNRQAVARSEEIAAALEGVWRSESDRDQRDGVLVVDVEGAEGYYCQFLVGSASVLAELVGQHHLSPEYRLGVHQGRMLANTGWTEPDPPTQPNHHRTYELRRGQERHGFREIAQDVIRALVLAYRVGRGPGDDQAGWSSGVVILG